jgi:hypothetical protein
MSDFLDSVKADLLGVRLRLAVLVLAVALVAAIAYAVLGGGSSATPPGSPAPISTSLGGIAVSQAPSNAQAPIAETTNGSSQQSGASRNPFTPLPEAVAASSTTGKTTASSSAGSAAKGATGSTSPGTGTTTTPAPASKPAAPKAPVVIYETALLFGVAAPGAPPQSLQLTPFENLTRLTPLPSAKQPLLVFRGVSAGGKSATFTVVSEAILHGPAVCIPSPSQCQAFDLAPGQVEELGFVSGGRSVTYQLHVVSISSTKASAASAARAFRAESKQGRELLRRNGATALPGLTYSQQQGVLVLNAPRAFGARASVAARRGDGR